MAAHRYWRLWFSPENGYGDTGQIAISELELRDTPAGSNVATGGSISASSEYSGSFTAAKLLDGSTAAGNGWKTVDDSRLGSWVKYDFGSGNEKDIVEVVLKAPVATGTGINTVAYLPTSFILQYSDDDIEWVTNSGVFGITWDWGDIKTLDLSAFSPIPDNFLERPVLRRFDATIPAALQKSATKAGHFLSPANKNKPYRHTIFTGNYHIKGSTTSLGELAVRTVLLIDQATGILADRVDTLNTGGYFEFNDIAEGAWSVIGVDDTGIQNSIIYAHVMAAIQEA